MSNEYIINDKRTAFRLDVNAIIGYKSIAENNFQMCKDAIKSGNNILKCDSEIDDIRDELVSGMSVIKDKLNNDIDIAKLTKRMDFLIERLSEKGKIFSGSDLLTFDKYFEQVINLSIGGIKFTSDKYFYPKTKLILSLELMPDKKKIIAFATAQYVDNNSSGDIHDAFQSFFKDSENSSLKGQGSFIVKATLDFFNLDGKEVLKSYLESKL